MPIRPFSVAACAVLLAATAASAQPMHGRFRQQMAERLAQRRAQESRPIDLQAIAPGARKITESYGEDPRQAIDVYLPPRAERAPVIVMVHGGAWMVGDKSNVGSVENKLKRWLPKGFIFVSVNYRMLPDAMAYDQALDVAAALRHVQAHAAAWGGDPDRLILMGHSAGAHIVALLSSRPDLVGHDWAGTVVLDSAAMSVPDVMARRHPRFYDRAFGPDPAGWAKASPMDQWTPRAVPMLVVCSTERRDHPCDEANLFQAKVEAAGKQMPIVPEPLSHADINRTLGLPSHYTAAVEAFIDGRIRARR